MRHSAQAAVSEDVLYRKIMFMAVDAAGCSSIPKRESGIRPNVIYNAPQRGCLIQGTGKGRVVLPERNFMTDGQTRKRMKLANF